MRKFYTRTMNGKVRCIRCREHFGSIKELAKHYASDGTCLLALLPEHMEQAA